MPYRLDEFLADVAVLPEVNSTEWDLPETEWPKVCLTDGDTRQVVTIPMNNVISRLMLYFFDKYGQERGTDNAYRFLLILNFCARYRKHLVQNELAINKPDGTVDVRTDFIRFLLDGFQEPVPPVIFGQHDATDENGNLSYRKVMQRWRSEKENNHV